MNGRILAWTAEGWEDYLYWQTQDRKTLKRINTLIEDILRDDPFRGHRQAGAAETCPGRRLVQTHRRGKQGCLFANDHYVTILQARYHY